MSSNGKKWPNPSVKPTVNCVPPLSAAHVERYSPPSCRISALTERRYRKTPTGPRPRRFRLSAPRVGVTLPATNGAHEPVDAKLAPNSCSASKGAVE